MKFKAAYEQEDNEQRKIAQRHPQNTDNPSATRKDKGKWPKYTGSVNKSQEKSVGPAFEV